MADATPVEEIVVTDKIRLGYNTEWLKGPGGVAHDDEPAWVQFGLKEALMQRRQVMREINAQMKDMQESLSRHHLVGDHGARPSASPPMPNLASDGPRKQTNYMS